MAGRSTKRARFDAPSSKDANAPTQAAAGGAPSGADEDVVGRLRAELETATKCIEQLRREKDYETRQVREEEQTRSATALKELETRLKADCRRDVDRARETVRSRLEADTTRLVGRYERTVKRLSGDLDRCRNELREEVEKRGVSSATRGGFETERCRLLAEVRDLKAAKRRLEESVESAAEVDKQKTAELKRTQEACKAELAKVSREANAEIRKLLEELKAKDHQLALLDRNQYSDRGAGLPKHTTADNQCKETETPPSRPARPASAAGEVVDKTSEMVAELKKDVKKLKDQLAVSESDKNSMKVRIDELRRELTQRNETIANLHKIENRSEDSKQTSNAAKNQPKAVRFLLPGSTLPVLAREVEVTSSTPDDDDMSVCSEVSCASMSSTSSILSQDTTVLYDENIEKNYHVLLSEHLNLQRSIALLLSSWNASTTPASSSSSSSPPASSACASGQPTSATDCEEKSSKCDRQECIVEKDSMRVAMEAMKEKHAHIEQNVLLLQQQLQERHEQNEELEFRVFELEECAEKCKLAHCGNAADSLLEKTRSLEAELSTMSEQLGSYRALEAALGLGLRDYVDVVRRQLNNAENESNMSRLEVVALRKQLGEVTKCRLEDKPIVTTTNIDIEQRWLIETVERGGVTRLENADGPTVIDADDLSTCPMNCSMSTTSGFDDADSCASSVADMRLDEMPSEETWGFDDNDDVEAVENCNNNATATSKTETTDEPTSMSSAAENANNEDQAVVVRKTDDEVWLARIEKMESRLAQAMQAEQRARDQAALLGEEKDRRIAALQQQVDLLESNEFRLAETIRSLERLERTFNMHVRASSEDRSDSTSSSSSSTTVRRSSTDATSAATTACVVDEPFLLPVAQCPADAAASDSCFRDDNDDVVDLTEQEASAVLKVSLAKLRSVEADCDDVDRKIRELDVEATTTTTMMTDRDRDVVSAVEAACCSDGGWSVPIEVVDFEAEYRELEVLIRELKGVLIVENGTESDCGDGASRRHDDAIGSSEEETMREDRECSVGTSYSLPASPVFDVLRSPVGCLMAERSRELELSEMYFTQQIATLEQERDALREAVVDGETAMRELAIRLVEIEASERSLRDDVGRLRAKEDWMISRNDELMELVGRLEESVRAHRAGETEMRSRCERHAAGEADLGRELDEARDELRAAETRYRRWIGQLDDDKAELQRLVDDLMEKNVDLEAREAGLLCRIRRLESTEFGLRSETAELERALNDAAEQRDELLMQMTVKEEEEEVAKTTSVVDGWTQTEDDVEVEAARWRKLNERAEFFKELLEFTEQSYAALETRLGEHAATETTLRATVAEYEKIDRIQADRTAALETDNERMAKKIGELERTVEVMESRYRQLNADEQAYKMQLQTGDADEFINDYYQKKHQDATDAFKGIMLLSEVADELDETEMLMWAAVEGAASTGCDDVTETALTSPMWTDVEIRMGLNAQPEARKRPHSPPSTLTLTPLPSSSNDHHHHQQQQQPRSQPPPLPLSPPPTSPARVASISSLLSVEQRVGEQSSSRVDEHRGFPDSLRLANSIDDVDGLSGMKKRSSVLDVKPSSSSVVRTQQQSPRSQSADLFSSSRTPPPSGEQHWKRAASEQREIIKESPPADEAAYKAAVAAVRDPVMERITKSREFWSSRSVSMPGRQGPASEAASTSPRGPATGRRSLIPRIDPSIRTPAFQRSTSEFNRTGPMSVATAMPVIRSTPSPHLSPRSSESDLMDDRKKSYIPRPIGDSRPTANDREIKEQSSGARPKTDNSGRHGQRETSKTYTTVLGPNRFLTSTFSYLSGSSAHPHAVRNSDSKTSPASSSSMATNQLQRPVVSSSTARSPEVSQLPGSRA